MEQGATAGQPKYKISSIFKYFFFFNFLFYVGIKPISYLYFLGPSRILKTIRHEKIDPVILS